MLFHLFPCIFFSLMNIIVPYYMHKGFREYVINKRMSQCIVICTPFFDIHPAVFLQHDISLTSITTISALPLPYHCPVTIFHRKIMRKLLSIYILNKFFPEQHDYFFNSKGNRNLSLRKQNKCNNNKILVISDYRITL